MLQNRLKVIKQKKMLKNLKKEIKYLENAKKYPEKVNSKNKIIKNLKISVKKIHQIAPYILTASIASSKLFSVCGLPFMNDNISIKKYKNTMTETDSNGNIRYEEKYGKFKNAVNRIYYYSEWKLNNNGTYSRIVKEYNMSNKSYNQLIELFNTKDYDNDNLKQLLENPDSTITETKNNINNELTNKPSFKTIIFNKNKDEFEYVTYKKQDGDDLVLLFLYFIVIYISEIIPSYYRKNVSSFNYRRSVADLNEQYKPIDVDYITKKLEIKKDNYNRLTR